MILTYTAEEKDIGRTVHGVLRREMRISATLLRRLKTADAISVSGKTVFTDYKLTPGETVSVDISVAEAPCDNIPELGDIDVLFENEGLLAVNKPTGMIVHPSRSRNTGTLSNYVAGYLAPKRDSCHVVNRLDRDTSGVVLFAKNSYMKALASAAISDKSAVKEYFALVYGVMPERGVIDAPIRRLEERNMLRVVSQDGQRAVTHYETIGVYSVDCHAAHFDLCEGLKVLAITEDDDFSGTQVSLVRLRLETGRTHQIRVHCLHVGHPVLGDKLYNTEDSAAVSQSLGILTQSLHAFKLGFTEPISGEYIEITAPTPEEFIMHNS